MYKQLGEVQMWFNDFTSKIRQSKLINWGFNSNSWLWFHIFAGSLLLKALLVFGVVTWLAVLITVLVAIIWEFIEFWLENDGKWENVENIYSSVERWKWDTFGDVFGVVIIILIILI